MRLGAFRKAFILSFLNRFFPKQKTYESKYIFLPVWEAKTKRNQPETKDPIQAEVAAFLQLQPKVAISLERIERAGVVTLRYIYGHVTNTGMLHMRAN